ncbi:MAG: hypothetical protein QY326_03260 [Bdellovibrionota bacterium]|nr:MAG: hypothetical protein QY326_03260 [Bdellovibrionota bacterium]
MPQQHKDDGTEQAAEKDTAPVSKLEPVRPFDVTVVANVRVKPIGESLDPVDATVNERATSPSGEFFRVHTYA